MGLPADHVTVFTDAYPWGWGGVLRDLHVGGLWPPNESRHINILELLTVKLVLTHFQSQIQGRHVLVRSDNTATCAYLNRQGGVKSPRLRSIASEILLWAHQILSSLRAAQIRGALNRGADRVSRWRRIGTYIRTWGPGYGRNSTGPT